MNFSKIVLLFHLPINHSEVSSSDNEYWPSQIVNQIWILTESDREPNLNIDRVRSWTKLEYWPSQIVNQTWILTESDREPNLNIDRVRSWTKRGFVRPFLLQCVTWSLFVVVKIFRSRERWYICDIFLKQSYWRKENKILMAILEKNMAQTCNFKTKSKNMSKIHFLLSHWQTSFFVPHPGLSPQLF